MNTTNILLGTTSLLLIVAFAFSFGGFNKEKDSPTSKALREQLMAELAKEEAETEALRLERLRASSSYVAPSVLPPAPIASEVESVKPADAALLEQLEEVKNANANLEAKANDLEAALETSKEETNEAYKEKMKVKLEQEAQAKRIRMALLMGTVTNANKDNALVIFQPSESANFQPGKVLNVRRNDGIVGQIVVDSLRDNLYVCTMRPHGYSPDGYPDIQPGDEVIFDHGDQ